MENTGEFDDLGLLINGVNDPIFPLGHTKTSKATVGKVNQLLRVRGTGGATKTENFKEDLSKVFRVTSAEILKRVEDGF